MRAVIFDMDGVLTDSEPLICAAACEMFREKGVSVQPEDFLPFVGMGENRYIGGVAEKYGVALDIVDAKARTYELYLRLVPEKLTAFPGAVELVRECRAAGLPCAVASSADRIKIDANLRKIGLPPEMWQAVVTAEDVERRKPDPDLFLKAAERLGVSPGACTVVEDAVNGIAAAKAAGMRCVAVASTFPAELLGQADLVRPSIAAVALGDVQARISIVIPTLNSGKTLEACLGAILSQRMARSSYEIVIADAGSSDATLEIARRMGVDVIAENPLKTGEAGKAAGIKASSGELIALVDSDNILPDETWLEQMAAPFTDAEIAASEPIAYTARKGDPALTRYFALLGMNDPLCLFTGNYDRLCAVTGKWTGLDVRQQDMGGFLKLTLTEAALPTIGANGFVLRRSLLNHVAWYPYFFDIDVMHQAVRQGLRHVAKVKTGIVHLYCARLGEFAKKQRRRIRDFLFFAQEKQRTYPWDKQRRTGIVLFALATVTVLPVALQAAIGCARKPDVAWLYHVPVCWVTLWTYGVGTLRKLLGLKQAPVARDGWQKE